jgi:hypothetical protein
MARTKVSSSPSSGTRGSTGTVCVSWSAYYVFQRLSQMISQRQSFQCTRALAKAQQKAMSDGLIGPSTGYACTSVILRYLIPVLVPRTFSLDRQPCSFTRSFNGNSPPTVAYYHPCIPPASSATHPPLHRLAIHHLGQPHALHTLHHAAPSARRQSSSHR